VNDRMTKSAEWRFLAALSRASSGLATTWWSLIVVRGALPAAFALAIGAVVGAVQRDTSLAGPLTVIAFVFIAINALGPIHEVVGSILGAKTGAWLHDRLIEACVEPAGLAHLEDADLADELATGRDFDLGITAPPLSMALPQIGNGFAEVAGGLAQSLVLAGHRWWAPLLVGGAWASTHLLLRESALWKIWQAEGVVSETRHVDYAYKLAVDAPAAKEMRLFGLADWAVESFTARRRRLAEILYKERRLRQRPLGWSLVTIVGANAIVFWSLARDAVADRIAPESLVVFAVAALGTSALAFGEFDWWFRGSAQPIPRVLDLADRMRPVGELPSGQGNAEGLPARDLRFHNVRFAYKSSASPVLDGFDLTIPAGRSMAIVGPNGAGKTTLMKLLSRFYDPQEGSILVDGVDLRELNLQSWRKRVAAVFQDFVRYELPLRDNVAPGGASDDEVRAALERSGAADLAELGTILSRAYEGGTELSGGQWQRIALARTLCAVHLGAGVVILDEPTAQLDVRGETEIFDNILEATHGRTTILISHRFSTVRHADQICVLEGGRVVELGSHQELMEFGGRYRTMFDLQAARFGLDDEETDAARA
jgi:ATP-binding cassette subfamily B protein